MRFSAPRCSSSPFSVHLPGDRQIHGKGLNWRCQGLVPALLVWLGMALPPTAATAEIVAERYPTMGTYVTLKVVAPDGKEDDARKAIEKAKADVQAFVDKVSSWDPRSDTGRINANAGKSPQPIDPALMKILERAQAVSKASDGAFDLTFSPVGRLWLLRPVDPVIPSDADIKRALRLVGYENLVLDPTAGTAFLKKPGMRIDLGAIAKGAAIDVAAASLKNSGFPNALVDAGGDLYAMGKKPDGPWILGVRNPRGDRLELLGKLPLEDKAITTSGDYEKMVEIDGKRYHHILNPKTGRPADRSISVTVIGPDAMTADAWSTTLFILGPEDGRKLCERLERIEALFVDPEFKITRTSGFPKLLERRETR